jgi:hypothetical protein
LRHHPYLLASSLLLASACGPASPTTDASIELDAGRDAPVDAPSRPGDAPTDAPSDASTTVVLSNLASGCSAPADSVEAVLPEEAGHYAATRLAPPSYPFRVTSLDYMVGHRAGEVPDCDGGLAHHVHVSVIDGVAPSATPSSDGSVVRTFDVEAAVVTEFRAVHLELTPPIDLTTGQSIVISVEQAVDDPAAPTTVCCIAACPGAPPIATVDWWSSAASEPYAWADLVAEFDYPVNLWITATGSSLR